MTRQYRKEQWYWVKGQTGNNTFLEYLQYKGKLDKHIGLFMDMTHEVQIDFKAKTFYSKHITEATPIRFYDLIDIQTNSARYIKEYCDGQDK